MQNWMTRTLPIGVRIWITKRWCVCMCGVWSLSRWTERQYGQSRVITETRASKPRELMPETWHFHVALIQGYHINVSLLSEWPPGRKWVEGHDLQSKSQTLLATVLREWQGKLQRPNLSVPDGSIIWVDGWWKSLKTCILSSLLKKSSTLIRK